MVRDTIFWKPGANVLYTEDQIMGIFLRHDKNGDRQLSKAELGEAFDELGAKCPPVRAWLARHYADDNHDGFISIDNELNKLVKYVLELKYALH